MHDREILVPCDDSVVRVSTGGAEPVELPIRRSRGYAPLPIALPVDVPPTLAVGADLKNTLAVAEGRYAWLSQHIGDMDDLATLSAFDAAQRHLRALTGVDPEIVVADAPSADTAPPRGRSRNRGAEPVRHVQHHHAHIAAVMAEHGLDGSEQVLGFAFDGTGYGPDGAVWGGEVLLADYKEYRRLAHLKYVPLAGGDTSVRAAVPDGTGAPVGGRDRMGRRPATGAGLPRGRTRVLRAPTRDRPRHAPRPPAWAGCSTPWRRWPACVRWWRTRHRRRSSSKGCSRGVADERDGMPSASPPSAGRRRSTPPPCCRR